MATIVYTTDIFDETFDVPLNERTFLDPVEEGPPPEGVEGLFPMMTFGDGL